MFMTEGVTLDGWNVDAIHDHRIEGDKLMFLTRWEGCEQGPFTWEPVGNFIHRYSWKLPEYCNQHGLTLDLVKYLSDHPLPDEE